MKLSVKCFNYLTNRGNGKKCKLASLINGRHQDCQFKTNGMIESSTLKVKIRYICALATRCKEWHDNNKQNEHYSNVIEPQIEKIYENLEKKELIKE
ncbi:MAG TPA: hypothetical protein VFD40_01470 [Candidatus Paceibacterota bacterium]|nr:hypothetical protein [Candidatus Paceibacterota bacterium]